MDRLCLGMALAVCLGCGGTKPPLSSRPRTIDPHVVAVTNTFSLTLLREMIQRGKRTNVFISPLSVAMALAMAYNGARGETKEAIGKALGWEGLTPQEINETFRDLRALLVNPDENVEVIIANSLWTRQGFPFDPDFLGRNRRYFGSEVTPLDFNDPQAVEVINRWVLEKTRGKIPKILDVIAPHEVLFFISVLYFKGQWKKAFDGKKTRPLPFFLTEGQMKKVMMMSQESEFPYLRDPQNGFQALALPYGSGRICFFVFLPDKGNSLKDFLTRLDADTWTEWTKRFQRRRVVVRLPRFRLTYEAILNETLKGMGMAIAFDPFRANFFGMVTSSPSALRERLFITQVRHKTFIEVKEEGTEAAATTSAGIGLTSVTPEFTVNRPFFFAISDRVTGIILFLGVAFDPESF